MVSHFSMQPMFRTTSLTVDTSQAQQRFYDDDDGSGSLLGDAGVLGDGSLDSGLEMSPPMGADSRRESYVSSAMFSPKTEDWQSAVEMQSVPSNNPFLDQPQSSSSSGGNPFLQQQSQQQQPFGAPPHAGAWSLGTTGSGACTPLQQFDGLPTEYDASASSAAGSVFARGAGMAAPFGVPGQLGMFSALTQQHSNGSSLATSPHKDHWLGGASAQVMVKKMDPSSPTLRSHNDMRRGDGIRKKNARFDIPAERNLSNIDHLIAKSTDELEIKELKQQKRLLRNRQAA